MHVIVSCVEEAVMVYLFLFRGSAFGALAPFVMPYMIGREDKRTNNRTMLPALKNNAAAGYQGPVKIELLKSAGLLGHSFEINIPWNFVHFCDHIHE